MYVSLKILIPPAILNAPPYVLLLAFCVLCIDNPPFNTRDPVLAFDDTVVLLKFVLNVDAKPCT